MNQVNGRHPSGPGSRAEPALALWNRWRQGERPSVRAFVAGAGRLTSAELVAVLRVDQREHWLLGERVKAEAYLKSFPQLAGGEHALDLVYAEFLLREQLGEVAVVNDYVRRFPELREEFLQQVELHRVLGSSSGEHAAVPPEDRWTVAGSEAPGVSALGRPQLVPIPEGLEAYEIKELLGVGGMGRVLKGFDPTLQRYVAIKVMAEELATSPTGRQRFLREARAAAAVKHPHVVAVHAVADNPLMPFLVMEYIAGESLQHRLDREGRLPLMDLVRIGHQTALGLAAAHAQGLVHRDVKPANILLARRVDGTEQVKTTDFGLARAVDDASLTQSGVITGTPLYMAPEQARGEPVDHRADLFSLGSVLYTLCTGKPPFRPGPALTILKRVCDETPPPIRTLVPDIPEWLTRLIAKLHAKDPAARYQSATEVADLLEKQLDRLETSPPIPYPPGGEGTGGEEPVVVPEPKRRGKHRLLLAALLLLAAVATAGWSWLPGGSSATEEAWVPLFNGKDLTGWKTHPDQPGQWEVKDGLLIGSGPQSHLFTERADFENFHLRIEARVNAGGESGLTVRSQFALQLVKDSFCPPGYRIPILAHAEDTPGPSSLLDLMDAQGVAFKGVRTPPEEWFLLEIIANGNRLIIQVNGTTTVDVVDPYQRYRKGHVALQQLAPGSVVQFRKVEVKELPPTPTAEPASPFAILAQDGRAEQPFATLADAVAAAQSGDTVEVRGDGPYLLTPIDIGERQLTIRAGSNCRPILRLRPDEEKAAYLIKVGAALVLEGLDLGRVGYETHQLGGPLRALLWNAPGGSVRLAHCRLEVHEGTCLLSFDQAELLDCEVYRTGERWAAFCVPFGMLQLENCVVGAGLGIACEHVKSGQPQGRIVLRHNTLIAQVPVNVYPTTRGIAAVGSEKPMTVEATANVFRASRALLCFGPRLLNTKAKVNLAETEALLPHLLRWQGQDNFYAPDGGLIELADWWTPVALAGHKTLSDWKGIWGAAEPGSRLGQVHFQGEGAVLRNPARASAADFRLADDSPGKGAGPGGRDLGADVDRVGPGAPHERWKKTPAYQEWLKTTGQGILLCPREPPGQKQDNEPKIGKLIVQTIPAKHYVFGSIQTDFKSMGEPVVKTLTALGDAAKEKKAGLHGPVLHYYYGAPHRAPDKPFKMQTGFFVPEGTKESDSFQVRELPKFKCATILYIGPAPRIGDAWQELYRSLQAQGLTPTDEERELYLNWEGVDSPNNIVQVQVGVK